ncbi:MAG TPA: hypothetical protein VJN21_13475 [Candidatus Acidoferrales bacterium]|nr:hypothetical protein [Candidatus Acidoferrales bacterium]
MAVNTTKLPARGASSHSATSHKSYTRAAVRHPSDDEILGLVTSVPRPAAEEESATAAENDAPAAGVNSPVPAVPPAQEGNSPASESSAQTAPPVPVELAPILEANPQLRQAWDATHEYQQVFATPAAARDAQQQLADLDGMFFSANPTDHAALAARIHELSPESFHGLAQAMQAHAAKFAAPPADAQLAPASAPQEAPTEASSPAAEEISAPPAAVSAPPVASSSAVAQPASDPRQAAKVAFFHDTNAAAVEQILGAIHSQVDRLLPDSIGAGARNRIVGEIYRELDATLRANRQLGKQLRDAFQSGAGDAAHQRAIVTLVTGRARQALPAVAKRVIGEWTQSIVAANRERLGRHEAAAKRVDISGAGPSDGVNRKPRSSRDINYRKLSDADILNL